MYVIIYIYILYKLLRDSVVGCLWLIKNMGFEAHKFGSKREWNCIHWICFCWALQGAGYSYRPHYQ